MRALAVGCPAELRTSGAGMPPELTATLPFCVSAPARTCNTPKAFKPQPCVHTMDTTHQPVSPLHFDIRGALSLVDHTLD